ncbi:hypothetical protein JQ596_09830 [Bradyrhizobium manausense]|uniref:hypothetical protein n=1 Tax=Bradyrhizobium TaxID=374 RepID=UPI001BA6944A|nr:MULTISPECIES: hypothetical protein [Bradyrhizobium]MBR0825836.1 hypothetical protein [Bradyrhizobium manausense]UVO33179.1 hypothetical protein KUF59_11520 [Bradyrhizobium arachidis]
MKWFVREEPQDIWDEVVPGPLGDIEAADRIRGICESAAGCADAVGRADGGDKRSDERRKRETERYERAARSAMEIAMKISDDLMRDDAVRRIVDLCMKANDIKTAQILFRAIQATWIRETVQRDYPALAG